MMLRNRNMIRANNAVMDRIAVVWLWIGRHLRYRPATVLGVLTGALIFVGLMGWVVIEQERNQNDIERLAAGLCGGKKIDVPMTDEVRKNCRLLFERLFDSATPRQIDRARRILDK